MRVPKTILVVAAFALVGLVVASAIVPATASDRAAFRGGVQVPPQSMGDALRYERAWIMDGDTLREEVLVTLGAAASATDAYGIARDVDSATVSIRGPDGDADYACSFLRGSTMLVRRDTLAGQHLVAMSGTWSGLPFTDTYTRQSTQTLDLASSYDGPCSGRHTLGGTTLREGDRLTLAEALGGAVRMPNADLTLTAPGVATTWEERDALAFTFTGEELRVTATWADGVAGLARLEVAGPIVATERGWLGTSDEEPLTITLRAMELGSEPLAPLTGAALPATNPSATFVAADTLLVDDSPFAPTYPYAAAIAGLHTDPATCAREMLARPDAFVWHAAWDADARDYLAPAAPTQGGWTIHLLSGTDACSVYTVRVAAHALLPPVTRNYDEEGPIPLIVSALDTPALPAQVADAATVEALAGLAGIDPRAVRHAQWTLAMRHGEPGLHLRLSEVSPDPREEGTSESGAVDIEATTGALLAIMTATTEMNEEPLPLESAAAFPAYERNALGALGGPGVGQGLAVAGIAGALLLLAEFVLLPLYSRLRRSTLLDNPVRARLYDAVRRDPGIHRAALIDFAGIGVGATTRHLRQLVEHHYLVETRDGGFARYYAAGEVPPAVARREATLRAGSHREVYELFRAEPTLTLREAGARLGMSAPSVYRAKKKLVSQGLLPAAPEAQVVEA